MVYMIHKFTDPKESTYNLSLKVPIYKSFKIKTTLTFYNKQFDFTKKVTFERGKYKIFLDIDKFGHIDVNVSRIGDYKPETYEL